MIGSAAMKIKLICTVGLIVGLGASPGGMVRRQSASSGTVSGQVTDPQQAIGAVAARLIDVSTNGARTTVTNDAGRYDFVNIPPGTYDLTVSKSSFSLGSDQRPKSQRGAR